MQAVRLAVAATAVGALVVASPAWSHIPAIGETRFETVSASAGVDEVEVSGRVAFGGQSPVVLASDPAGDNLGAQATQPLGVDLTGVAVAHRDADEDELTFELRLADLRTSRGTPETVQYNWDVAVDGGADKGGSNWSIKTMGTRVAHTQGVSPWAAVNTCVPGGTTNTSFTCSETYRAEAVYDTASRTIYVNLPMSAIAARPGSTVAAWSRSGSPVWVGASAGGQRTLVETYDGIADHGDYLVPAGKTVEVGIAAAGELPSDLTPLLVSSTNGFSGRLAVPGPGNYNVLVRACFAGNCAERVLTTTVVAA